MKYFFLFLLILLAIPALAEPVTYNHIVNHYEITLPPEDRGSIYLNEDHTFMILPALDNIKYVHNCWGRWKFDEKKQMMRLSSARECPAMNGNYCVLAKDRKLFLTSKKLKLVLRSFVSRRY